MTIKRLIYILSAVIVMLLLASCTSTFDKLLKGSDQEAKYKAAMEYYGKKKYSRAALLLDNVVLYYRGTPRDDSVNFFLAKSYFLDDDMYAAAHFLDQFRNTFPRSTFTEEAYYLRCVSLYSMTHRSSLDPKPTTQTLSAITEFLYLYPSNAWIENINTMQNDLMHRVDEKAYNSAALYYKIEEYKSAVTALKTTLKDNPNTSYREDILYLILASSYELARYSVPERQRDRYQSVIDEYYNIISEYPETKHKEKVNDMHQEALNFLGK